MVLEKWVVNFVTRFSKNHWGDLVKEGKMSWECSTNGRY